MKTIYKYPLLEIGEQIIVMPSGYKILTVQQQDGELTLWALVDTDQAETRVRIDIYGTGRRATGVMDEQYLGTVQMDNGLVWHLFIVD